MSSCLYQLVIVGYAFLALSLLPKAWSSTLSSLCYRDVEPITGIEIVDPLSVATYHSFIGKAVLIVNTASFCDFTSQYLDFNVLQDEYGDDLLILAFPCNQFGLQEPGVGVEILHSLQYVRPGGGYIPRFPVTAKVAVNGPDAHPLFDKLKKSCPPVKMEIGDPKGRYWSPFQVGDITWNFNKFLLNKQGVPFKRYDSTVTPMELRSDINAVLAEVDFLRNSERPQMPAYITDNAPNPN